MSVIILSYRSLKRKKKKIIGKKKKTGRSQVCKAFK